MGLSAFAAAAVFSAGCSTGNTAPPTVAATVTPSPSVTATVAPAAAASTVPVDPALTNRILALMDQAALTVADVGQGSIVVETRSSLAGDLLGGAADDAARNQLVQEQILAQHLVTFRTSDGGQINLAIQVYASVTGAQQAMNDARSDVDKVQQRFAGSPPGSAEAHVVDVPAVGDESFGIDAVVRQKGPPGGAAMIETHYGTLIARKGTFKVSIATSPPWDYAAINKLTGVELDRLPNAVPLHD